MKIVKSETNNGIIAKITNIRTHINADKLEIATVCGDTVIIELNQFKEGDSVAYFDSNLCLSRDFIRDNNLFSKSELNADPTKKGYFSNACNIRPVKLRQEKSYGFVTSLESIASFVGCEVKDLKDGMEFNELNGVHVCKKYIKPQNKEYGNGMGGVKKSGESSVMFPKHWDTKHFKKNLHTIPAGRLVYIEEKEHGTSARTANVKVERILKWYEKLASKLGIKVDKKEWKVLNGSRNTNIRQSNGKLGCRDVMYEKVKNNIKKNEQLYYEISGYELNGGWIQKQFPYGCMPGQHRDTLYRVTFNDEDGKVYDMSREYVYNRAIELGMNAPILFEKYYFDGDVDKLVSVVESYTDGRSAVNDDTLREGVVVWFEDNEGKWTCLKNKSFDFLEYEGKAKEKDDYVDLEELEEQE